MLNKYLGLAMLLGLGRILRRYKETMLCVY
jgi:hypothetical protein